MGNRNRLHYFEPNNNLDRNDNVPFLQEDMNMSVDIQCITPDRFSCGNGLMQDNTIKFHSTITYDKSQLGKPHYMSFMEGSDISTPNGSHKELTTRYLDVSFTYGSPDSIPSKENLCIESIDIQYSKSYNIVPNVTIKFVDVRGASLFGPSENELRSFAGNNRSESNTYINFFSALFHFPYPMFLMTVKGFYGYPVTYTLSVSDFKSSFNSQTGNFDVTVSFIGYEYGILSDIPLNLLLAAPMANGETWNNSITYDDGNPVLSACEFYRNVKNFCFEMKRLEDDEDSSISRSRKATEIKDSLDNINRNWGEFVKSFSGIIPDSKTTEISLSNGVSFMVISFKSGATADLSVCSGKYKSFVSAVEDYSSEYGELNIPELYGLDYFNGGEHKIAESFSDGLNERICFTAFATKNPNNEYKVSDSLKWLINGENLFEKDTVYKKDLINEKINSSNIDGLSYGDRCIILPIILNSVNSVMTENEEELTVVSTESASDINRLYTNVLGFTPTIYNIFVTFFAHLSCFTDGFYSLLDEIKNNSNGRTLSASNLTAVETDVPSNKTWFPPFPKFYKVDDSEGVTVEAYPGISAIGMGKLEECGYVSRLVNGVMSTAKEIRNIDIESATRESIYDSVQNSKGDPFFPISVFDIEYDTNPYINLANEFVDDCDFDVFIGELLYMYEIREKQSRSTIQGKFFQNILGNGVSEIEAFNFANAFFNSDKPWRKTFIEKLRALNVTDTKTYVNNFISKYGKDKILSLDKTYSKFYTPIAKDGSFEEAKDFDYEIFFFNSNDEFNRKFDAIMRMPENRDDIKGYSAYGECIKGALSQKNFPYEDAGKFFSTTFEDFLKEASETERLIRTVRANGTEYKSEDVCRDILRNGLLMCYFAKVQSGVRYYNSYYDFDRYKGNENLLIEFFLKQICFDYFGHSSDYEYGTYNVVRWENYKSCYIMIPYFVMLNNAYHDFTKDKDYGTNEANAINAVNKIIFDKFKDKWLEEWKTIKEIILNKDNYDEKRAVLNKDKSRIIFDIMHKVVCVKIIRTDNSKELSLYDTTSRHVFIEKIKELSEGINIIDDTNVDKEFERMESEMMANDGEMLSLYKLLQTLYNRWLCSYSKEQFEISDFNSELERRKSRYMNSSAYKNGDVDGSCSTVFNNFLFVDSFYRDISHRFIIDPKTILSIIEGHFDGDTNYSLLQLIEEIAGKNNLLFQALPCYSNFYDEEGLKSIFAPSPEYTMKHGVGNTYLLMHTSEVSQYGDNESMGYKDDGFQLNVGDECIGDPVELLFSNENNTQKNLNLEVPAFGVTFGRQNQSIFKSIDVNMDNPMVTEESIKNLFNIINMRKDGEYVTTPDTMANNLYSVYANRSYTCSVTMMGCANIMPFMYFQLNNIPMFRGCYTIVSVKHSIRPGDFTTTFTGVRVSKKQLPIDSNIFRLPTSVYETYTNTYIEMCDDIKEMRGNVSDYAMDGLGSGWFSGKTQKQILEKLGLSNVINSSDINIAEKLCRTVNLGKDNYGNDIGTVKLNKDTIEDLKSIIEEIKQKVPKFHIKITSGFREKNSVKNGLSNHCKGIAIDLTNSAKEGIMYNPWFGENGGNKHIKKDDWKYQKPKGSKCGWGYKLYKLPGDGGYDPDYCLWSWDHPVVQIFNAHGWGWGGAYGDTMHFSLGVEKTKEGMLKGG